MNILHLTLTKNWFDLILSGEKKEEYREIKPYWEKRLNGKTYDLTYEEAREALVKALIRTYKNEQL